MVAETAAATAAARGSDGGSNEGSDGQRQRKKWRQRGGAMAAAKGSDSGNNGGSNGQGRRQRCEGQQWRQRRAATVSNGGSDGACGSNGEARSPATVPAMAPATAPQWRQQREATFGNGDSDGASDGCQQRAPAMVTVTADRSGVERSTAVRPGTTVLQGRGKSLRKLHRRAPPANDRRCRPGHSCCR